jgi:integrase
MGKTEPTRRQRRGQAWHWKQTDCWYYTLPGTKNRAPLVDEVGRRIRGKENREAAELALARIKLAGKWRLAAEPPGEGEWLVAKVCSEYIQHCRRGTGAGSISQGHCESAVRYLNGLCEYCGAMGVSQLKRGHVQAWVEGHAIWSAATRRNVITIVLAAFNYAQAMHDVPNTLRGLKKPPAQPRLHSLSSEEEQMLLGATDECFRDFLFAAIRTGLRPFCELARLTADHVEETARGMMWRVYASKTKKTRKIPVRPEIAELTRRLMKSAPKGSAIPLFRNTQEKPWKPVTGRGRFLKIKKRLGWDKAPVRRKYSCYSCRHTFAHRMLSGYWNGGAGCSIETLAELIGDTPKVAFDHYGRQWGQHYQEPLWAAIGGSGRKADTGPVGGMSGEGPAQPAAGKHGRKHKARMGRRARATPRGGRASR